MGSLLTVIKKISPEVIRSQILKTVKKKIIRIRHMESLRYQERTWWMHQAVNSS